MISSPYCALSTVCSRQFWFMVDVTRCYISQLLTWSKFLVNCHYDGCEALCFVLSDVTWWNNFVVVKIKEAVGKRIEVASKISYVVRKEYRFAFHRDSNIGVLRLRNTDRKSSLIPSRLSDNFVLSGPKKTNSYFLFKSLLKLTTSLIRLRF